MTNQHQKAIVIDASRGVLGRIASYAAKQALLGKNVIIINCNNALITGRERTTINEYQIMRKRGGASLNGPFFPKHPDRIMKRTIRGMLPHLQQRGIDALKRVKCYSNAPEEHISGEKITFHRDIRAKVINLEALSREI